MAVQVLKKFLYSTFTDSDVRQGRVWTGTLVWKLAIRFTGEHRAELMIQYTGFAFLVTA